MKHKLNPVLDAQLNRNRQRRGGHRRNLSDGRISSAITDHLGEDVSTIFRSITFLKYESFMTERITFSSTLSSFHPTTYIPCVFTNIYSRDLSEHFL